MLIDRNGLIIPKEKSNKKIKQTIFKSFSIASIIGFCLTGIGIYYQKLNYELQTRKYENEINKLQEEVKLSCTQLRVSYINCDAGALNILLKDDYHIVDNQIINWLYDKKYEHINYEKINKKFEHDKKDDIQGLEITFLSLESFGNRNIFNLRLEYDDIRYKKNTTIDWEAFKDINLKNKNIMSIERKLMKLGDRKVGEKLLIPLFLNII